MIKRLIQFIYIKNDNSIIESIKKVKKNFFLINFSEKVI